MQAIFSPLAVFVVTTVIALMPTLSHAGPQAWANGRVSALRYEVNDLRQRLKFAYDTSARSVHSMRDLLTIREVELKFLEQGMASDELWEIDQLANRVTTLEYAILRELDRTPGAAIYTSLGLLEMIAKADKTVDFLIHYLAERATTPPNEERAEQFARAMGVVYDQNFLATMQLLWQQVERKNPPLDQVKSTFLVAHAPSSLLHLTGRFSPRLVELRVEQERLMTRFLDFAEKSFGLKAADQVKRASLSTVQLTRDELADLLRAPQMSELLKFSLEMQMQIRRMIDRTYQSIHNSMRSGVLSAYQVGRAQADDICSDLLTRGRLKLDLQLQSI